MMTLWFQRYTQRASPVPGAVTSVLVHAAVIGAGIGATASQTPDDDPPPISSIARFLAPPNRTGGQRPQQEMIRYVAISVPQGAGLTQAVPRTATEPASDRSALDDIDAQPLADVRGADSAFSLLEVDSAASRYEWSAAPAFPPRMLAERQGGFVIAEWVVTEDGYADTTTFRIIDSTHPEFTKAVRDALPFMRFRPATIGRVTVRQLVQQQFAFQVTTAAADTPRTRPPL